MKCGHWSSLQWCHVSFLLTDLKENLVAHCLHWTDFSFKHKNFTSWLFNSLQSSNKAFSMQFPHKTMNDYSLLIYPLLWDNFLFIFFKRKNWDKQEKVEKVQVEDWQSTFLLKTRFSVFFHFTKIEQTKMSTPPTQATHSLTPSIARTPTPSDPSGIDVHKQKYIQSYSHPYHITSTSNDFLILQFFFTNAKGISVLETERAIPIIKNTFQKAFSTALHLYRVSAPLMVDPMSGFQGVLYIFVCVYIFKHIFLHTY